MEETLKNPESELKGNASGNAEDSEGGSSFLIYRLIALADQNRSTAALIGCVLLITLLDIIFDRFLFEPYERRFRVRNPENLPKWISVLPLKSGKRFWQWYWAP